MKRKIVLLFVVFVVFSFVGSGIINAFAQKDPPQQLDMNVENFNISGDRTTELLENAITIQPGDCTNLISPYFEGVKRDMTLNEDTTHIQVYYDDNIGSVCAIVFGKWPGRVTNDGIQEFDSIMRVYRGYELLEVQDESLIRTNPFSNGVPFHVYAWQLPRGGGEYYFLFDFFEQQILGDQRLGMSHRDWSGLFRSEMYKIFLPIIFKPEPIIPTPTPTPFPPTPTPVPPTPTPTPVPPTPTPIPTCPEWTIGATAPGFTVPPLTYEIGGNNYPNVEYLYFGETMAVRIKNSNGTVSDLPVGGETTVYNGVGQVVAEYGRDGSFEVVGGQGVFGEDFFTFDSSFPWQGINCRASFTIWDPELVLNALQENLQISRQEAIDLLDEYLLETNTNTLTQDDVWEWVKTH